MKELILFVVFTLVIFLLTPGGVLSLPMGEGDKWDAKSLAPLHFFKKGDQTPYKFWSLIGNSLFHAALASAIIVWGAPVVLANL